MKELSKQIFDKQGRPIECKSCGYRFQLEEDKKIIWQENKYICPNCKQLYCNKPKTEISLFLLQDEFLKNNKDEKILRKMYDILLSYGTSLFLKTFKKIHLQPQEIKYYVENAISLFIEEIYYVKDLKITTSFGGFLILKLKQALYSKQEKPLEEISLDYQLPDFNYVQYEDKKDYFEYIEREYDSYLLINSLYKLIIEIENYIDTPFENYMRELALSIHLSKGEKYADRFYSVYSKKGRFDKAGKLAYIYSLELLKNKLEEEHLKNY